MAFRAQRTPPRHALSLGPRRAAPSGRAQAVQDEQGLARRHMLGALAGLPLVASSSPALAGAEVGSYLPSAGVEDFVLFVPSRSKTPALRAGTVDPDQPYKFALPPSWKESPVANIQSGNYCQPRCAEPWTEVIFAGDSEGKASVIVSPLVRLTNQKDAKIEDVGDLEGFVTSVGPFITGTYLDLEDIQSMRSEKLDDGLTYYYYDIYATYGLRGPHTLTAATVKGDLALLFCVAATDKQYARSKKKLNEMIKTFRA